VNMFTVITPTGDRPEPFKLCCHFMQRQSVYPTEWIIVDDGVVPTSPPDLPFVKYIRRINTSPEGVHTLPLQMIEALQHVTTDKIIMFEDDDWYCSDYFERMLKLFEQHPKAKLIGQDKAVYYHIPFRKCFQLSNVDRASLCQSAFRVELIASIVHICNTINNPFIDIVMWQVRKGSKYAKEKYLLTDAPPMCVGIKGLPGRVCKKTIGHRGLHPKFKPDPNLSKLRSFIGNDVSLYQKFKYVRHSTPIERSSAVGHARHIKTAMNNSSRSVFR